MTLAQIIEAVKAGKKVHWSNPGYQVLFNTGGNPDNPRHYLIGWDHGGRNPNYIGLTWTDGVTMNGKEDQFYIGD